MKLGERKRRENTLNTIVEFRSEEMRKLRGNEWNAVLVMYSKINE